MSAREAPPTPRAPRRVSIRIAAALAIALAGAYAWNVWRNADAIARIEAACARIRDARATRWAALEQPAEAIFAEDLPLVREMFATLGDEPCRELPAAIGSPLAIGAFRAWQGAAYPPDRLRELAEAAERARARCVPLMEELIDAFGAPGPDRTASARAGCDQMMEGFAAYARAPREASIPRAVWDWPGDLEHLAATIESVPPR